MKKFFNYEQKFGFGCMRLPMLDEDNIDIEQFKLMVDTFISSGFTYFDTAHGYHRGLSEIALKEVLTSRYPRSAYSLTDKLTEPYFDKEEDIRPFFMKQLEILGVDYFDFYLMHAQNRNNFIKFKRCHAYETAFKLKEEGYIKHVGISFHDTADVLDQILTEYPEIEAVQIQFNYLDYEDPSIQSRLCYETCVKHNKPVIIMEPIRGGRLINLTDIPSKILQKSGLSAANLALRFAASQENVMMVLSGMSNIEQMNDNLSFMKDFTPISKEEFDLSQEIASAIRNEHLIPCTGCEYCVAGCPMKIKIPDLFSLYNSKKYYHDWNADFFFKNKIDDGSGRPSECISCGQCESACPQHLEIRELLIKVKEEFE